MNNEVNGNGNGDGVKPKNDKDTMLDVLIIKANHQGKMDIMSIDPSKEFMLDTLICAMKIVVKRKDIPRNNSFLSSLKRFRK